ncbi:MAG: vanadium-dependent haloperoxidase [Alphaproteobacteria bacterium]|nr:vanadium-dependent haloperoxidase [Alphaproteobacteria bacterium]
MLKKFAGICLAAALFVAPAQASAPEEVMSNWYTLLLNLVRHTATYSPPVASRAFAYVGVTVYEATASGDAGLQTLAGQLNGLKSLPLREAGKAYDEGVVMNAALDSAMQDFFSNTGPSGQHALAAHSKNMKTNTAKGVAPDVAKRSAAYGIALEKAILAWSKTDGGAVIENLGFPKVYSVSKEPGHWVPTSTYQIQQHPLLPDWGNNRPFAMPEGATCPLPAPTAYSEDKASQFYKEAKDVYDAKINGTPEQKKIARFWSDDPGLSWTPPGHWVGIVLDIMQERKLSAAKAAEALARVGIAIADGFIGCWNQKYKYDTIRPVTYIKKNIDPKWEALLITPPFPEYPSGHSTQTGAAATALTAMFGENFAFNDSTHERDGMGIRHFNSLWDAAQEAGISRLYGGIHFRPAIDNGLDQGKCIGKYAAALKMAK